MYVCVFVCNKGYKRIVRVCRVRWRIENASKSRLHIIRRTVSYIFRYFRMYSINGNHNHNLSFVSIYEDTMYAIIKIRIYLYAREMCTIDHTIYIYIYLYSRISRIFMYFIYVYMCVCVYAYMREYGYTQIIRIDPWSCTCVYWCTCTCAQHHNSYDSLSLARAYGNNSSIYFYMQKQKFFYHSGTAYIR